MKNNKGFTLVELLAVVAIIAILTIIALPNVMKLFRKSTEETMLIQETEVLDAANLYKQDYCGRTALDNTKRGECNNSLNNNIIADSNVENKKDIFFCLNTLQNASYAGKVLYSGGTPCEGIVVYTYDENTAKFSQGKTYLRCGENGYSTQNIEPKYLDAINKCYGEAQTQEPIPEIEPTYTYTYTSSQLSSIGDTHFGIKIRKLANPGSTVIFDDQTKLYKINNTEDSEKNIKKILRYNGEVPEKYKTDEYKISGSNTYTGIYTWFDEEKGTIYIGGNTDRFNLPTLSSGLFSKLENLEEIDMSMFTTTKNTKVANNVQYTLNHLFYKDTKLKKINMSSFVSENVKQVDSMFNGCSSLEEVSFGENFDASKITSTVSMFENCTSLKKIDLKNFKTTNALSSINGMFYKCSNVTEIDISGLNTKNVSKANNNNVGFTSVFYDCQMLESIKFGPDFSINTAKSLASMFYNCKRLKDESLKANNETGFPGFESMIGSNIASFDHTFYNCQRLENVDLRNLNPTVSEINLSYMFNGCSNLNNVYLNNLKLTGVISGSNNKKNIFSENNNVIVHTSTSEISKYNSLTPKPSVVISD